MMEGLQSVGILALYGILILGFIVLCKLIKKIK